MPRHGGNGDLPHAAEPPLEEDDFDTDTFLAAWDEAAREAASVLVDALPGEIGRPPPQPDLADAARAVRAGVESGLWPFDHIARANVWIDGPVPDDDRETVLWAAGALLIMEEDPGLDSGAASYVLTLEFGDWLGAVLGLVRAGPGADAAPAALVDHICACPEVEGEIDDADRSVVEAAFGVIAPSWEAAGVIDADRRLTRLGRWILPRMLTLAWGVDFDAA
ncbi:MAG: hypothetical protein HUU25_05905 [Candidatus Sumerlaeia bacterium]|nr:hypothetical protein [Candidatus Sumerlaeia bacterium]